MNFNKEDILTRLQNGDNLDTISKELTDVLNEANAEFQKQQAANQERERVETKKHEIACRLLNDIKEFGLLEGADPDLLDIDEEDIAALVKMLSDTFTVMHHVKKLTTKLSADASDDEVLAKFLNDLFGA